MMANRTHPDAAPSAIAPRPPLARGAVGVFLLGVAVSVALAWAVLHEEQKAAAARFALHTARMTMQWRQSLQEASTALYSARAALGDAPPAHAASRIERFGEIDNGTPLRALHWVDATAESGAHEGHPADSAAASAHAGPEPASRVETTAVMPPILQRAADTGRATLAITPPEADAGAQWSLIVPVYAAAPVANTAGRRAALRGFLIAALAPERLFGMSNQEQRDIGLRVSAGTPPGPVYTSDSGPGESDGALLQRSDTLDFDGTALELQYTAERRPARIRTDTIATVVLIAGLAATCLITLLAHRLGTRREAPQDNTEALNEARMMGIIRSSMEAIITIDEAQTVVLFNPAAERVFGVSAMDAIGAPLARFIPERFRGAHARHVEQFGVTGVSERQMGRQRVLFGLRANGEEFPIEASISQTRDASGKLYTVMLRDVTERVRSEDALKRSREELRELSANLQNVREEEKTRIARELHDDLGQQLTALKMDVSAITAALSRFRQDQPDAPPVAEAERHLQGMRRLIDSTVASVRRIAADLRPVMLDDLGLVPAIEWLANDFTQRYGIAVQRDIDLGDVCLTNIGATTLFRIVQEALTNVARHAEASEVRLKLKIEDGFCVLVIADNGRGLARRAGGSDKSFGLIGIRERAHMLNGTVAIDNAPGQGLSITVALPLHAVEQEDEAT